MTNTEEVTVASMSRSNSSGASDHDFNPSADMLAHDVDDEGTLESEERLQNPEEVKEELEDLQKESSMPLEQLLALYYGNHSGRDDRGLETNTVLKDVVADGAENSEIADSDSRSTGDAFFDPQREEVDIDPFQTQRVTRGVAALNAHYFEDYSSDEDYNPVEDWKKDVQIGDDYQAQIAEVLSPYKPGETTRELDDKLLWKPDVISEELLKKFLEVVLRPSDSSVYMSDRDDEQALYTLLQCGNFDEAVSMRLEQTKQPPEVNLWSEEECQSFEQGLRAFGKDFGQIQRNKVSTRSVGEIVQFYYLWKKTERHDAFVTQSKLGRKKYNFPGVADYMDRFIDESESALSSRSSSPYTVAIHDQREHLAAGSHSDDVGRKRAESQHQSAWRPSSEDPGYMLLTGEKHEHANMYSRYLQPGHHLHDHGADASQSRHHGYDVDGSQPLHHGAGVKAHRARTSAKDDVSEPCLAVATSCVDQRASGQSTDRARLSSVAGTAGDSKGENAPQLPRASQELQWRKSPQVLQTVGEN